MDKLKTALTFSILSVVLTGCGSSNGLRSISIDQSAATAAPKFVATGSFTNGRVISALPVSWTEVGPGIDATGATEYSLSPAPFFPVCVISGGTYTVVAIAPVGPHPPSSGTVPTAVWNDLVAGRVMSEGGFVGATAQFTCA